MFDFHEKRKIRKILFSKVAIILVFLITGMIGLSVYERFMVEREMAAKLQVREEELARLHVRAATLESKVEHMQNERGIEEEIRSRFDVVKDGEQVVVILDDREQTGGSTSTKEGVQPKEAPRTFLETIEGWFD